MQWGCPIRRHAERPASLGLVQTIPSASMNVVKYRTPCKVQSLGHHVLRSLCLDLILSHVNAGEIIGHDSGLFQKAK